jgi:hypothetical protein
MICNNLFQHGNRLALNIGKPTAANVDPVTHLSLAEYSNIVVLQSLCSIEIADILHISVITLDLMLGSLKKQGMLTKEKGTFSVNTALLNELSPCPLEREDAQGCKSNHAKV